MTNEEIDCKGVISALDALTRNGELRDYDDELANRLEDAKEIVKRYTALSSAGRLVGDGKDACAKCGHPRAEHSINGACYGLCGEFVASHPALDATDWKAKCEAAERVLDLIDNQRYAAQAENEKLRSALSKLVEDIMSLIIFPFGAEHAGAQNGKELIRAQSAARSASAALTTQPSKTETRDA